MGGGGGWREQREEMAEDKEREETVVKDMEHGNVRSVNTRKKK